MKKDFKTLLSFSKKHYDYKKDKVLNTSIIGFMGQTLYHLLQEFGEVDYIDSTEWVEGRTYDLLYSLPRNIWYLSRKNNFKKIICHLNIAEPKFLKKGMLIDGRKIGARLTDCYQPLNIYGADKFIHYGTEFSKQQYINRGISSERLMIVYRGADDVPYRSRCEDTSKP